MKIVLVTVAVLFGVVLFVAGSAGHYPKASDDPVIKRLLKNRPDINPDDFDRWDRQLRRGEPVQ